MCLEGVGMGEERRNPVSWYRDMVFLYRGNEGNLLSPDPLPYFSPPPSWVIFIPGTPGMGEGKEKQQL